MPPRLDLERWLGSGSSHSSVRTASKTDYARVVTLARYGWALRSHIVGPERIVTGEQVDAVTRSGVLDLRGRSRVRALLYRELLAGTPNRATISVAGTRVELGSSGDFDVDWKAFVEVFGHQSYSAYYADSHVLDIGAHKGYFGAFALAKGAKTVVSFEPEAKNYAALERAARKLGSRWLARNAAVGPSSGTGVLLRDRTSWAHSLVAVERPDGQQLVEISTLERALAELPAGGMRTIVKIDAEGSECGILSRPDALDHVDVLMVEWHSNAPCTAAELSSVVKSSGLLAVDEPSGILRFER